MSVYGKNLTFNRLITFLSECGLPLKYTQCKCSLKEAKILDKEDHVSRRRIKGAIKIHPKGGQN